MVNSVLVYLLQVSLVFAILYFFYYLFVSKLTFHGANRVLLILLPILSLLLPLVDWDVKWSLEQEVLPLVAADNVTFLNVETVALVENETIAGSDSVVQYPVYLLWGYVFGVLVKWVFFASNILRFSRIRENSLQTQFKGIKLRWCDIMVPFAYFNTVYVPKKTKGDLDQMILEHEMGHVTYAHSVDLLLAEIYHCFFWFNPLLYPYRKSLKSLHEFQADQFVLSRYASTTSYLQLLLDTVQKKPEHSTFSYFNNPTIKKRVMMITKKKSKRRAVLKYIPVVTAIAGISLGFSVSAEDASIPEKPHDPREVIMAATPPTIFPLESYDEKQITSSFGQKVRQPKTGLVLVHNGIDIRASKGTPVLATADGTVAKANNENDWGNLVVLVHDDGYQTRYAHLDGFNVTTNEHVQKGAVIGYVGSTGNSSGPHLHYEVLKDGQSLDPMSFFRK